VRLATTCRLFILAGVMILSFGDGTALAGGWPLEPGTGEIIVSVSRMTAGERYDQNGNKIWKSHYTKHEISPYGEYGLTKNLTLIGEAAWSRETTDFFGLTFEDRGVSRVKAGARYAVGSWNGTLFSVHSLAVLFLDDQGNDPAATKRNDIDTDLALVLARNDELFGLPIFSVQELGWIARNSGRPDQIRADITLGTKPWPGAMLLAKSFNSAATRDTSAGDLYRASKIAFSVVLDLPAEFGPGWAFEAGTERTISGRSTVDERTWRAALWYRF
jgi:hypothetical protein